MRQYQEDQISDIVRVRNMQSFKATIRQIDLEISSYDAHIKRALEQLKFRLDLGVNAQ